MSDTTTGHEAPGTKAELNANLDYVRGRLIRDHHIDPIKLEGASIEELKEHLIHRDGQLIAKLWDDIRQLTNVRNELISEVAEKDVEIGRIYSKLNDTLR